MTALSQRVLAGATQPRPEAPPLARRDGSRRVVRCAYADPRRDSWREDSNALRCDAIPLSGVFCHEQAGKRHWLFGASVCARHVLCPVFQPRTRDTLPS